MSSNLARHATYNRGKQNREESRKAFKRVRVDVEPVRIDWVAIAPPYVLSEEETWDGADDADGVRGYTSSIDVTRLWKRNSVGWCVKLVGPR
jgi:hypothetical protein